MKMNYKIFFSMKLKPDQFQQERQKINLKSDTVLLSYTIVFLFI